MMDRGGEFSFSRVIHVRFDIRIGIYISKRAKTTKFGT